MPKRRPLLRARDAVKPIMMIKIEPVENLS
jgi:hypothetical protein